MAYTSNNSDSSSPVVDHPGIRSPKKAPHRGGRNSFTPTITLAVWQLRSTWRLLLLTGAAILVAVVLVCMVPLYSQVAMSAGLRDALKSAPIGPYVIVHSLAESLSLQAIRQDENQVDQQVHLGLGKYIDSPKEFSVRNSLPLYKEQRRGLAGKPVLLPAKDQVALLGFSISQASGHLKLMQGRLPQDSSQNIEIAITPQTAAILHVTIGSTIFVQFNYDIPLTLNFPIGQHDTLKLPLHIVGLFSLPAQNDPFWHGEAFQPGPLTQPTGAEEPPKRYPALVSNQAMLTVVNQMLTAAITRAATGLTVPNLLLASPFDLFSYYPIDTARFDIQNLDDLNSRLNTALTGLSNNPYDPPYFDKTAAIAPLDVVTGYSNRIAVVSIPLSSLTYLIVALVLFFVSLMTALLVDRQDQAIALLRSRGASRRQIFGSLTVQSLAVGLIALLVGPFLAIVAARFIAQATLAPTDQGVISLITHNPVQIAWGLRWSVLLTAVIAVLAMVFSIVRAIRMDVLALRRETARSTHQPFWQRIRLDLTAAVIALVGYAFSLYVTAPGVLDERVRVLILPATTVVGALFLLLGCTLLLLRFFPSILRLASWLASRSRGATPMLAIAQMARAPRQALRMTTLLALALAMATFTLSFSASQAQRVPDVAAYQVGSDFSGTFQLGTIASFDSWQQQEAAYRHIPGVTSATIGYVNFVPATEGSLSTSIDLRVMNATSYAQTTWWTPRDSSQSAASLMQQLIANRTLPASEKVVPAIVDAATANQLHLSIGSRFTINDVNNPVKVIVVAEIDHIPTINDSPDASSSSDSIAFGGVLVDFQSYSDYSRIINNQGVTVTNIWLRTGDDPASLASVRAAISKGDLQLTGLNDRRAIINGLSNDPLYLTLIVILYIGAATALLLAIAGNLALSWQTVRSRLTNFAIMRALGSTPREMAAILIWEQCIVYATSIIVGLAFGIIFSAIALPALVFTAVLTTSGSEPITTAQFFVMQNVPPVHMVLPYTLVAIAPGILIIVSLAALGMMVRVASHPSISMTLRVGQD